MNIDFYTKGIAFTAMPEAFLKVKSLNKLKQTALATNRSILSGYMQRKMNGVALVDKHGVVIDHRIKEHLTVSEQQRGFRVGKIRPFKYEDLTILPIVCYEILYPEDYYHFKKIDFVTHHVGFEMFDMYQFEGWRALERAVAQRYNCPVVVSCGGKENEMNLSGIVLPYGEQEDYTLPKYMKFRKHIGGDVI